MLKRRPAVVSVPVAVLLLGALCSCGRDQEKPESSPASQAQPAVAAKDRSAAFPEAQAAAVLRAISDGEVAMATVATEVSQSEAVIAYARVVASDYRAIARLVDSTSAAIGQVAAENELSAELRAAGDSIAAGLRVLPSGFNNTFIEEQVKANQRALVLMDTALIPSARSPQLKNLFVALRPTVAAHLQRSMQILAERKRVAEERGEPWQSGLNIVPPAQQPGVAEPEPPADTVPPDTTGERRTSAR